VIAWATIDAALAAAVTTASGVSDVRWKWQPPKMRAAGNATGASIDLKRSPVSRFGKDETLYTAGVASLEAYQKGQRSFALEVRCTSDRGAPSDSAPIDASDVLSVLMTRIYRPSVLAALRTAGVALSTMGAIVRSDFTVDKREHGLAILTLTFLCADVDTDTDEYWIESFTGTLVVTTPDGSEITTPFSGEVN
jgi:hypothetical protein